MIPEPPFLFVYGTLMSQADGDMAKLLAEHASKLSDGLYQGKMFRVSRPDGSLVYPAVIPSCDESDLIHGEVYRLSSLDIFDLLDDYEACGPSSPKPHEYHRKQVQIKLQDNQTIEAYIYLYALSTDSLSPIPSGSFQ